MTRSDPQRGSSHPRHAPETPGHSLDDVLRQVLCQIPAGRVLDVATSRGGFIGVLLEHLPGYRAIVGIDIQEHLLRAARERFDREDVHLAQMDAGRLAFAEASFDTVCLAASIHHLADAAPILAEMLRVLQPGGHFVLVEMHADVQTEAQRSTVQLHHWAARVDRALGFPHYSTLSRQEILDCVQALGLEDLACYDPSSPQGDPRDAEAIRGCNNTIERYLERARELDIYPALEQRGEEIRRHIQQVGVQPEPFIVIVGRL